MLGNYKLLPHAVQERERETAPLNIPINSPTVYDVTAPAVITETSSQSMPNSVAKQQPSCWSLVASTLTVPYT